MNSKESSSLNMSNWQRTLTALFIIAFLCRGVFMLTLQDGFYFPDSVDYWAAAVRLLTHGEFGETYGRAPVYPLFLAGIFALFTQSLLAVRVVEAMMGAGVVILIAIMARRIGGQQVGALAGLLWSLYPLGIFIAGLVYPTGLATALLVCALLCLVKKPSEELSLAPIVGGGIFLGLAVLTIPVALVTVSSTALWIVYSQPTRRLLLATLFLCGVALPLTLWTSRNFHVHDRFVLVEPRIAEKFPPIVKAEKDKGDKKSGDKIMPGLERSQAFANHFLHQFRNFWELYPSRIKMDNPIFRENRHEVDARVVKQTVFTASRTSLVSVLSVGPMFLFGLIGGGAMWFQKEHRSHLLLLGSTILSFALGYSFFWGKMRYRFPIEPYVVILSAYGLTHTWLALARRLRRRPLPNVDKV